MYQNSEMGQRFLKSQKGQDMIKEYQKAWGKIQISSSLRELDGEKYRSIDL